MSVAQDIQRAMNTTAKQVMADAPYDKSRTGMVVDYDEATNTYSVIVDRVTYEKIPIVYGLKASVNDIVKVVYPTNNISQMYINSICPLDKIKFYLPIDATEVITPNIILYDNVRKSSIGSNATTTSVGWNWDNRDGALLTLRSVDYTTGNDGAFSLVARDGTNSRALTGYPSGGLNWGGTPVSLQGHTHTNPISVPAQKSISFKATAANTWQYTGLSFTIPSGHQYLTRVWEDWNSGKPIGVGFETSTAIGTKGFPTYNFENANGFYTPPVFLLPAGTFYLFEKRATVPTSANTDYVSFIGFNLGAIT